MATTVARLQAVLDADTSKFDRDIDRSHKRLSGFAKGAALGLGAAGVGGAIATLKIGWDEWTESTKVTAQTNAVLKSTGEIANVTTKHVQDLAGAILKKTGIDDEQIQTGENMLLTFTNIRNEVGKGNDIFDQATQATADLSVALGRDMQGTALMVGKALNQMDVTAQGNIRGFQALRRVGVNFTAQQQVMAVQMIKSGDVIGAQKILLGELNKEFGGSAEAAGKTLPGQINILKETFNNFAGDLIGKMIPALMDVGAWFRLHWPAIRLAIESFWDSVEPILKNLIEVVKGVYRAIHDNWDKIGPIIEDLAQVIKSAMKIIGDTLKVVSDLLKGDWSQAWKDIKVLVGDAIQGIKNVINLEKDAIVTVLTNLGTALKNAVVAGLTGIGGAAWGVINNIGEWVDEKIEMIKGWGASVANHIKNAVVNTLAGIGQAAWGVVNNIADFIGDAGDKIEVVKGWGANIANWIKNAVVNTITGIGSSVWEKIHNIWEFLLEKKEVVQGWGERLANWLKNALLDALTGLGGEIWKAIKGAFSGLGGKLSDLNPFGDGEGPTGVGAIAGLTGGDATINQALWDEIALAKRDGLVLTSGYRPGAMTKHGTPSDHGVFPSKAIDVAGSAANMAMFFRQMIGRPGIKQAFYDPLGSIFGGVLSSYREGGHSDHVHVATYDKGGFLRPGWNLAFNGLGRPEPVGSSGPPQIINLVVDGRTLAQVLIDPLRNEAQLVQQRTGRPAFGT